MSEFSKGCRKKQSMWAHPADKNIQQYSVNPWKYFGIEAHPTLAGMPELP